MNRLPKNFLFPPDVEQVNVLTKYNNSFNNENVVKNSQNLPTKNNTNNNNLSEYEPTQPSTKNNSSYLRSNTKNKVSITKVQSTVKSQKIVQINHNNLNKPQQPHPNNNNNSSTQTKPTKLNTKQFLANTNGPQMLNRLRKRQTYNQSSDSQSHITDNINTPSSTQKGEIKSKKKLIKTQLMPPKNNKQAKNIRSSVQKRQKYKMEQKEKIKSKLNPWRTNIKKEEKIQSDLQSSPNTTLFNNNSNNNNNTNSKFNNNSSSSKFNNNSSSNNTSNNKGFDRKSDHYSESQYIQLSQKFSTVTDGKFFNNRSYGINNNNINSNMINNNINNNNSNKQQYNQDQIQQNIEMQTNSMYSNSNQKKQKQYDKQKYQFNHLKQKKQFTPEKQQIINQSICDSLDRRSPQKDFQYIGRQSYYGLAERLMENYMQEKTRPFSPPLHQRQHTEEDQSPMFNRNQENQQKQVELVYDPVLNCYYDHKTHTYYQLKN